MGCLNVRGCNELEKRDEIGRMFAKCKLDILGLSEKKLRREGEMSFGGVRGVKSGVRRRRKEIEGVAVLMNERIWMSAKEIRRLNSNVLYVGLRIKSVTAVYAPGMEGSEEERDGF